MKKTIFLYSNEDFIYSVSQTATLNNASKFDEELQRSWSHARDEGHFRYHLHELETEIIPGKYSFISQLNVKRAQERRKPEHISSLTEPFNPDRFNFNRIKNEEILFYIKNKEDLMKHKDDDDLILINISPLEYCNSLYVFAPSLCQPQILQAKPLKSAIEMMLLSATTCMKIGFNSLGAYASVNHHHFHIYYLQHNLHIETVRAQLLAGKCYEICDYPAPAFAFELEDKNVDDLTSCIMKLANFCLEKSVPHNFIITRGSLLSGNDSKNTYDTVRVIFWARKAAFGSKDDTAFNPAFCELGGHLPIKKQSMFRNMNEEEVSSVLSDTCQEVFIKLRNDVKALFNCC